MFSFLFYQGIILFSTSLFRVTPEKFIAWKPSFKGAFLEICRHDKFNNAINLYQGSYRCRSYRQIYFAKKISALHSNMWLIPIAKRFQLSRNVKRQLYDDHNRDAKVTTRNDAIRIHLLEKDRVRNFFNRNDFILSQLSASLPWFMMKAANASGMESEMLNLNDDVYSSYVRVPLYYEPSIAAYVVYYRIGGDLFGAIVDTGSPFITIPSTSCNKSRTIINSNAGRWGCYREYNSQPTMLADTYERFANNEGIVRWRSASFSFNTDPIDAKNLVKGNTNDCYRQVACALGSSSNIIFGVLSESLMSGTGGVFLGLIRDTNQSIRPSFLSQLKFQSLQIDLRKEVTASCSQAVLNQEEKMNSLYSTSNSLQYLTLSTNRTWIHPKDRKDQLHCIHLVNVLNQKYGDPVVHYTAIATSVLVNGNSIQPSTANKKRTVYVIFDTGVTGMVVSKELWQDRYDMARRMKEKNLWNHIEIRFSNKNPLNMNNVPFYSLEANKPITTSFGTNPWPRFPSRDAYLVVIGLSFLDGHQLTIELDHHLLYID